MRQGGRGIRYLHQVGIPGIAADVEVVVAELLLGGLAEDMSWLRRGSISSRRTHRI